MNIGSKIREFKNLDGSRTSAAALSPDGRYALSVAVSKIILWEVATERMIRSVKAGSTLWPIWHLAFSLDGKNALSGGEDGIVKHWNIPSLSLAKEFKGHTGLSGIVMWLFLRTADLLCQAEGLMGLLNYGIFQLALRSSLYKRIQV
jgi:WD40 repeat protein